MRPNVQKNNSNLITESPISLPTQEDDLVSVKSNGEEKKSPIRKFIVKITTPTPSQPKLILKDKQKPQEDQQRAVQWPVHYSELNIGGRKMSLQPH